MATGAAILLIVWTVLTLRLACGEKPEPTPRCDVRRVVFEDDREY